MSVKMVEDRQTRGGTSGTKSDGKCRRGTAPFAVREREREIAQFAAFTFN